MYSWGRGMFGRLGLGSQKDEFFPVKVNFENPSGSGDCVKIVGIAAGAYHSLALAGSVTHFIHFSLHFLSLSVVLIFSICIHFNFLVCLVIDIIWFYISIAFFIKYGQTLGINDKFMFGCVVRLDEMRPY